MLKIDQKDCFSNNRNLNFNFDSENTCRFIDPRSIPGHKIGLERLWTVNNLRKTILLTTPFSPHPQIVVLFCFVLLALSHFLTNFFKEMYQITQEDILLQIRHVPNVFETSPFLKCTVLFFKILVETVKPFGCMKQFCDMQLAVDYILLCKLEIVSITRQIFIFKWN